ncbi:hypothetical protein HOT95_gp015 [Vibrio phage vB_VpS_PG07]|uniref:Uncharacterized protein n=3 Tax=Pogseptimavirus TaxID=2732037 RepID=A0A411BKV9_9CAUD|nr:hypothetical protein HOT95_gp015 [Vibrio phage vB_VpS_PG07]YP_009819626.1 hypothetical protein HOV08_gp114 [Vibrio phage VspSw_1]AXQ66640.1 hypothetical protein [Vibrio phage vB_VpS_PG07]QAY02182.1 hypothetical protein VspSw1_114 [Vibrio phage VspSw_1]QKN88512.1 hypothetical protein vBValSX1_119 [Vibrio phage vB_ValS_X1]
MQVSTDIFMVVEVQSEYVYGREGVKEVSRTTVKVFDQLYVGNAALANAAKAEAERLNKAHGCDVVKYVVETKPR